MSLLPGFPENEGNILMNEISPENLFESIEKHIKEMEGLAPMIDSSIPSDEVCANLLELCAQYI